MLNHHQENLDIKEIILLNMIIKRNMDKIDL